MIDYLPVVPIACMLCSIIGVGIWVHYTAYLVYQVEWALEVLGPGVTVQNLGRVEEAIIGTSSTYVIFACAMFGLGVWRKVMHVNHDLNGLNPRVSMAYRITNLIVGFLWWLEVVWVVVLMTGLAVLAMQTWVSYRAVEVVLKNQSAMQPVYASWVSGLSTGWTVNPAQLAAAGGDLIVAVMEANGWSRQVTCPSTCLNLLLFHYVEVDPANSCVCDVNVLGIVLTALDAALNAVPGMFVGIWFMYVCADFFKTGLACDYTEAVAEAKGPQHQLNAPGARGGQNVGRGYSKI